MKNIYTDKTGLFEDAYFEIKSINVYKNLKNLTEVTYISMVEEEILQPMKTDGIEII